MADIYFDLTDKRWAEMEAVLVEHGVVLTDVARKKLKDLLQETIEEESQLVHDSYDDGD